MTPRQRRLVIWANASLTVLFAAMIAAGVTIILTRPAPPETSRVLARGETLTTEPVRMRRVRYRVRKRPSAIAVEAPREAVDERAAAIKIIRVIPLRNWSLWCARIGGPACGELGRLEPPR